MPSHIPVGSTIAEVYYVVRSWWGVPDQIGEPRYADFDAALDEAADYWHSRRQTFIEVDLPESPVLPVAEEHWRIVPPKASKIPEIDMVIERIRFSAAQLVSSRERRDLEAHPAPLNKEV
jgi:hypothetical protein